jgi:hypothetical protein
MRFTRWRQNQIPFPLKGKIDRGGNESQLKPLSASRVSRSAAICMKRLLSLFMLAHGLCGVARRAASLGGG